MSMVRRSELCTVACKRVDATLFQKKTNEQKHTNNETVEYLKIFVVVVCVVFFVKGRQRSKFASTFFASDCILSAFEVIKWLSYQRRRFSHTGKIVIIQTSLQRLLCYLSVSKDFQKKNPQDQLFWSWHSDPDSRKITCWCKLFIHLHTTNNKNRTESKIPEVKHNLMLPHGSIINMAAGLAQPKLKVLGNLSHDTGCSEGLTFIWQFCRQEHTDC